VSVTNPNFSILYFCGKKVCRFQSGWS